MSSNEVQLKESFGLPFILGDLRLTAVKPPRSVSNKIVYITYKLGLSTN
jgi:hypothetical protein